MDIISTVAAASHAQELETDEFDYFYAELERRILTLISDDEKEESSSSWHAKRSSSLAKQPGRYFQYLMENNDNNGSGFAQVFQRNGSNGTGVFIPHAVGTRRRNKPRRKGNRRGRMNRPGDDQEEEEA